MRKFYFASLFTILLLPAKSQFNFSNIESHGISISTGWFGDNFHKLDFDQISQRSEYFASKGYDLDGYHVLPIYKMVHSATLGVSYSAKFRNQRGLHEFRVGLNISPEREPMIEYAPTSEEESMQRVTFCVVESEVNIQVSYLKHVSIFGSKRWNVHIGPDVNLGRTFNNSFFLITETKTDTKPTWESSNNRYYSPDHFGGGEYDENWNWSADYIVTEFNKYKASSSYFYRIRMNMGINYTFKKEHWVLGIETAPGIGLQQIQGWRAERFLTIQSNLRLTYWL